MARRIGGGRLVGFVPVVLMNAVLAAPAASLDIKNLTLEELMDIDVYSASRRLEPVQAIPSAAYVLTNEDIRRSRAQTIPEALRLVPGVNAISSVPSPFPLIRRSISESAGILIPTSNWRSSGRTCSIGITRNRFLSRATVSGRKSNEACTRR